MCQFGTCGQIVMVGFFRDRLSVRNGLGEHVGGLSQLGRIAMTRHNQDTWCQFVTVSLRETRKIFKAVLWCVVKMLAD